MTLKGHFLKTEPQLHCRNSNMFSQKGRTGGHGPETKFGSIPLRPAVNVRS